MERVDAVVIGAGVVGLAIARALAQSGREVLILETADAIGTETSSRNSEVIHAGIYYPQESLKARLCVEGRSLLYDYCKSRGIPHKQLGKLIVATEAGQERKLASIAAGAHACGVKDLRLLTAKEANALESQLTCTAALHSPSTGIIDSHAYMLSLQSDAEAYGAQVVFRTRATGGAIQSDGILVETEDRNGEGLAVLARTVINAAGHGSQSFANSLLGFSANSVPKQFFARGCYFSLRQNSPFARLIYPVPVEGGLGVHLTLDLAGEARFGPDVEWTDRVDYSVNPARANAFYAEIRRYWPALKDDALMPSYAGVRPKLSSAAEPAADFRVDGPRDHGIERLVNLFGIESPGLTASLAIAALVLDKLR